MRIEDIYKLFLKSNGINTDSRKISEGQIFWALKGDNFNGNLYCEKALNEGAAYAISDEIKSTDERVIKVNNSLETLQELAKLHRKNIKIPIIGLTGTNGKTTTKELIASVLSKKYNVGATSGNFNNHIGVPLTLLSFNNETEIGVVEMGANHKQEIDFLCDIAQPDYGLITNIGKAHLEGFGSFENVIKTKKELYNYIINTKGTIILNQDDSVLNENLNYNKLIYYGLGDKSICKPEIISDDEFLNIKINFSGNKYIEINSKLYGSYNMNNIAAAFSVGLNFDIKPEMIKEAIEGYIPSNNRSQIIQIGSNTYFSDAYNANPGSMKVAVDNFLNKSCEKKIFILGDMYELGKFSDEEHLKLINYLISRRNSGDILIFVGSYFEKVFNVNERNVFHYKSIEEVAKYFMKKQFENAYVLLKASRALKFETFFQFLKEN